MHMHSKPDVLRNALPGRLTGLAMAVTAGNAVPLINALMQIFCLALVVFLAMSTITLQLGDRLHITVG